MTALIEVQFLSTVTSSSTVRRRSFATEAEYAQWLSVVRYQVEVVSVRTVAA